MCTFMCAYPYHGHPAQCGDALADGWKVVEEAAATVSFSEALNLLDVIWNRLQEVLELCLQEQEGEIRKRTEDGCKREGSL